MKQGSKKQAFYRKKLFLWMAGVIVGVVVLVALAFRFSPWPGALVIRAVFTRNDVKTTQALEKYQPTEPIALLENQQYRAHDRDAFLDVYFPSKTDKTAKLPLIIWTHGGAWVSGDKKDNATYYKLLAAEGFTVISADYSRGPEKKYPIAVHQLNDLYAYVQANANRFHVDSNRIFLAGDSAGSQLSSQMATIITNPAYATALQIKPSLQPSQLKGVILNCGIYKMDALIQPDPTLPKLVGWGTDVSVWAYVGTRDFSDPVIRQMSAYYHATNAFPATYVTGGNADPLTDAQSRPFADKLESLGVPVTSLFYDASHQPALPHEYQFNLDTAEGKTALAATISFIKAKAQ